MNKSMIRYLLSKLLLIEAALLLVPVAVAIYYRESSQVFTALFSTIGILVLLGGSGILQKPKNQRIYAKEGVLIVALCWILWSFFGGLPFVFARQIPSVIDAFFEISSGFTTTGATILNDVSVLSRSLLFWRSFTHLIGGMGVLVFALAIMDNAKNSHLEVMKAEVPGPVFGKVVSKLKNTAQILYLLYLALFSLFVIIYYLAGMPLFDSFVIAMGTAGTGGFTVYNDGIAHYGSSLITYLVSIGVLVFGVNFNLYYYLMLRRVKAFFGDEELRAYLVIVLVSTGLISLIPSISTQDFPRALKWPSSRFPISLQRLVLVTEILPTGPSSPSLSFSSSWESVALLDQPQVDSRLFEASFFQKLLKIRFCQSYRPTVF